MAQRFEIRYDRWCGWLLGLLGMGRRASVVLVPCHVATVRVSVRERERLIRVLGAAG